jgi:hypothetical protein
MSTLRGTCARASPVDAVMTIVMNDCPVSPSRGSGEV